MFGLLAIVVLLIARSKLREKEAEVAAMATMMGLQKVNGTTVMSQTGSMIETAKFASTSDGESQVHEWTFGDKQDDLSKPGIHFRTKVKVQVVRKKV
jgi:hypothetical protein